MYIFLASKLMVFIKKETTQSCTYHAEDIVSRTACVFSDLQLPLSVTNVRCRNWRIKRPGNTICVEDAQLVCTNDRALKGNERSQSINDNSVSYFQYRFSLLTACLASFCIIVVTVFADDFAKMQGVAWSGNLTRNVNAMFHVCYLIYCRQMK